ncbi:MAG: hypothetical protein WC997_00745 [Porticoccaceae bacterium]
MEFLDTELMTAPGSNNVGKGGVIDIQVETLLEPPSKPAVAETKSFKVGTSAESFIHHNRFRS